MRKPDSHTSWFPGNCLAGIGSWESQSGSVSHLSSCKYCLLPDSWENIARIITDGENGVVSGAPFEWRMPPTNPALLGGACFTAGTVLRCPRLAPGPVKAPKPSTPSLPGPKVRSREIISFCATSPAGPCYGCSAYMCVCMRLLADGVLPWPIG